MTNHTMLAVQPDGDGYSVVWTNCPRGEEIYGPWPTKPEAEASIPEILARINVRTAFAAAGAALYGDSWQRQLARDGLRINERSVRRLLSGGTNISADHVAELEALIATRHREMVDAVAALKIAVAAAEKY